MLRRHERRELEVFKGLHSMANLPLEVWSQCGRFTIEAWSQWGRLTERDLSQCSRLTQRCLYQHGRLTQRGVVTVWQTYLPRTSGRDLLTHNEERWQKELLPRWDLNFIFNTKIEQRAVEKVVKGPLFWFLFLLMNETCFCLKAWGNLECNTST